MCPLKIRMLELIRLLMFLRNLKTRCRRCMGLKRNSRKVYLHVQKSQRYPTCIINCQIIIKLEHRKCKNLFKTRWLIAIATQVNNPFKIWETFVRLLSILTTIALTSPKRNKKGKCLKSHPNTFSTKTCTILP